MTPMLNLIQIEHHKLLRHHLFWILLIVLTACNALFISILWFENSQPIEELLWPREIGGGLEVLRVFGPMVVIILVGATIGQSYTWRTTQQALARGTSRGQLIMARFLGYWLPILFGFVLYSVLIQLINSMIFSLSKGGPVDLAAANWGQLAQGTAVTFLFMLAYAALTFLIAFATRSSVAAISGGLGMLFVLENLLPFIASRLGDWAIAAANYLPTLLYSALMNRLAAAHNDSAIEALAGVLPAANAAIGLLAYLILGVGLAFLLFQRQDLSG